MANNTFFGAWNPGTMVLPDTTDLDFGAWFISETGTIDDTTYKKGDWLIYICEARGTLSERSLWRMTNGVVLFNLDNHQNVPTSGYYTKIRLDNAGNIIDAGDLEYDDLPKEATDKFDLLTDDNIKKNIIEVLQTIFQSDTLNPIQLEYDDVTGKISAQLKLDEETIGLNEFGQLQAMGVAESDGSSTATVEFDTTKIDELEAKITEIENAITSLEPIEGDGIKIETVPGGRIFGLNLDGDSISINAYGQLCVNPNIFSEYAPNGEGGSGCANHEHDVSDISGLTEYIDNYISNVNILTQLQDNLADLVDGTTIQINSSGQLTAIAAAVGKHQHSMSDITDLDPEKADVWASQQYLHAKNSNEDFNDGAVVMGNLTIGEILISFNQLLQKHADKISQTANSVGKIEPAEPNNIFEAGIEAIYDAATELYDTETGKMVKCLPVLKVKTSQIVKYFGCYLNVYIDGSKVDTLNVFSHDGWDFNVGVVGNFNITYFGDAYPDAKSFQGFYNGYKVEFSYSGLSEGYHNVRFETVDVTSKETIQSESISVPVFETVTPQITFSAFNPLSSNKYVSGIKAYEGDGVITATIEAQCYKTRFAPLNQFTVKDSLNSEKDFESLTFENGKAILEYTTGITSDFNGKFTITAKCRNEIGTESAEVKATTDYVNFDTTKLEKYRVISDTSYTPNGDGSIVTFSDYPSATALLDKYNDEAQIVDDVAKVNFVNYKTSGIGPDYSNKPAKQYITLKFELPKKINNFYFDLLDGEKQELAENINGTKKNIEIYAAMSQNTTVQKWLNCNEPWIGYGNAGEEYLYNALDLYRSDKVRRYVTLGVRPTMVAGYLFIKIGFYNSIDLETLVESIEESLNERI